MTSTGALGSDRPDRVLLLVEEGSDRGLLDEWLMAVPDYELSVLTAGDDLPAEYDLCLFDAPSLERFRSALEERKNAEGAVYLPHVLLLTDEEGQSAVASDTLVDDVFTLPMREPSLKRRFDNLLKTRRLSRRLAERDDQYRQLVRLTPETILLVDDGTIVYANDAAAALFDTETTATLEGESLCTFVSPDDRAGLERFLQQIDATDTGAGAEFVEFTLTSATGAEIDAAITGVTVTFGGDPVSQLVIHDRTEQKERQNQLKLFERAIESAAQGITIADARQDDEPLVYANAGFERITGYSVDEILGRNCRFLQGRNTAEESVAVIRRAIDEGEPATVDLLNYRKDGTPFWNRLDIVPIEDSTGAVAYYLGLQRDITEQKQREQRLSVLNRVLRHNLRNKLTVVRGCAEQLEADGDPPADVAETIHGAVDSLLTISDHVRRFDTVITGDDQKTETMDIVAIVEDGAAALREQSPDAAVSVTGPDELSITGHSTLPAAVHDFLTQLAEVGRPHCTLDVRKDEGSVVVDVTDHAETLSRSDLELVDRGTETPLEHLQRLELWLLKWAVEQSGGEFLVQTDGDGPRLQLRLVPAPDDQEPSE